MRRPLQSSAIEALIENHWEEVTDHLLPSLLFLHPVHALEDPCGDDPGFAALKPQVGFYCAFAIRIQGRPLLLSAGHVFEQIRERDDQGYRVRFMDICTAESMRVGQPTRVRLGWSVERHEAVVSRGADFGFVELSGNEITRLTSAGCHTIDESLWPWEGEFPLFAALGAPLQERLVHQTFHGDRMNVQFGSIYGLMPLVASTRPTSAEQRARAVGWLDPVSRSVIVNGERVDLQSPVGMSGGPVFGLRPNAGGVEVTLVGIVTHWDPTLERVGVMPVAPILLELRRVLAQGGTA